MKGGKIQHKVLIVSGSEKAYGYISELLPSGEFFPVLRASGAGEAKRTLISFHADIVIINCPLPDDMGIELALDLSTDSVGVLLIVKSDSYDQISYKVEDNGVLTLPKPVTRQTFYSAVKLLAATQAKLFRMEKKNRTLQEKMADIRSVNRAKWLLIENLNMNEKDAHYYIEKQAMDTRLSRKEVAESIIRTYDK